MDKKSSIKYKSEVFLTVSKHRAYVISGAFFGCAAIDTLRADFAFKEEMPDNMNFLIPTIIFAGLALLFLIIGLSMASTYKKKALASRDNFMQNGTLSHGKVSAVGGGYHEKRYHNVNYIRRNRQRFILIWESVWWAEIEYYDETEGIYARHRVTDLNKNGRLHRLIGSEVEIYQLDQFLYVAFK